MGQISNEAILEEFKIKLSGYTRQAQCGREFVLVDSLQDWLRSPVDGGGTHADRLLYRVAYLNRPGPGVPIASDKFRPGDDCCLLVFCILQLLDRGELLHVFSRKGKVDRLLPLSQDDLQNILKTTQSDDQLLVSRFLDLQHRFRPARFELHGNTEWDENVVLPIYQKNEIKKGGTASLWQIDVPEEFVGKSLRDVCSGCKFNQNTDEKPDWRYQFALKTFSSKNRELWNNEMEAFMGLKHHEGMVKWLAGFEKTHTVIPPPGDSLERTDERKNNKTYNLLLEYGTMDLDVYFALKLPPMLPAEIQAFWKSLFAVADATKGIHNFKVGYAGQVNEFFGWHADIKPDNILYIEDRLKMDNNLDKDSTRLYENEITFKLADPGFAKFVKAQGNPTDIPKEYLLGGTETYGAPEYPGRSKMPVSQAIDIWSLACVFSLAATWIVHNYEGIRLFHKLRQRAIENCLEAQCNGISSHQHTGATSKGDYFHNKREVLDAVTEWHKYLRIVKRETDTVTSQVLDLVDEHMLLANPEQRIKANDLCFKLDRILQSCSRQNEPQLPTTLRALLGEIDEEESYNAAKSRSSHHILQENSSSGKTITSNILKPNRVVGPLVTTHRQSIWPDQSLRLQDGRYPEKQSLELWNEADPQPSSPNTSYTPQTPSKHHRHSSASSTSRILNRSRQPGNTKRHPPQNYFQACDAIQKREKKSKFWQKKHGYSDVLLTNYFGGSRDIIFLVDNADSMDDHWFEATKLLELLVKKAKGVDEDGMDLRFTTGNISLDNKDSASKFVESMKVARPKTRSKERAHTDLRRSLGGILTDYASKMRHRRGNVKDATVIILTDGVWAGMEDKDSVADLINKFLAQMKQYDYNFKHRPFSIQFIQFGNHLDATRRLKYLDDYTNNINDKSIPDIIDTEHSTGDVNKMLLGSFVEEYDKDEGDDLYLADVSEYSEAFSQFAISPESDHYSGVFNGDSPSRSGQRVAVDSQYQRTFS